MLSFSGSLKVFVAVEACDIRKGFNGLYVLVTERLGEDPRQAPCLSLATGGTRG
jgi:transposase